MTTELPDLLNATAHLIDRIDQACTQACRRVAGLDDDVPDGDRLLWDLAQEANDLHRQLEAFRTVAPHRYDALTGATVGAIDDLLGLLVEAKTHFAHGETNAGYGALTLFEQYAADLKSACQLRARILRRGS